MSARRTVAVIGASANRRKFGNQAVRAYQAAGWEVFPIHPTAVEIERLPAYPSVRAVPARLDRVLLYLPPQLGVKVLPDVAAVAPAEFYVNPGAESDELVAEAHRLGLDPLLACSLLAIGVRPE